MAAEDTDAVSTDKTASEQKPELPTETKLQPVIQNGSKPDFGQSVDSQAIHNDDSSSENSSVNGVNEPVSGAKKTEALYSAQMKIAGSLCFSCLQNLKDKMLTVTGVKKFEIITSKRSISRVYIPEALNWVEVVMVYDRAQTQLSAVKEQLLNRGYLVSRAAEKPLDQSVPPEKARQERP